MIYLKSYRVYNYILANFIPLLNIVVNFCKLKWILYHFKSSFPNLLELVTSLYTKFYVYMNCFQNTFFRPLNLVITHLEPDILECEVKWALGSITMNKASGGDGILVELFQILKDYAVKVLHSICQQIWKTQQWPQDWKKSVFIPIPKKGNAKECSNYHTIVLILHDSKVMLKILQARLQQYMKQTVPWTSRCSSCF